jgi:hypothetical protein
MTLERGFEDRGERLVLCFIFHHWFLFSSTGALLLCLGNSRLIHNQKLFENEFFSTLEEPIHPASMSHLVTIQHQMLNLTPYNSTDLETTKPADQQGPPPELLSFNNFISSSPICKDGKCFL